jgi:hypothetical protein
MVVSSPAPSSSTVSCTAVSAAFVGPTPFLANDLRDTPCSPGYASPAIGPVDISPAHRCDGRIDNLRGPVMVDEAPPLIPAAGDCTATANRPLRLIIVARPPSPSVAKQDEQRRPRPCTAYTRFLLSAVLMPFP